MSNRLDVRHNKKIHELFHVHNLGNIFKGGEEAIKKYFKNNKNVQFRYLKNRGNLYIIKNDFLF